MLAIFLAQSCMLEICRCPCLIYEPYYILYNIGNLPKKYASQEIWLFGDASIKNSKKMRSSAFEELMKMIAITARGNENNCTLST